MCYNVSMFLVVDYNSGVELFLASDEIKDAWKNRGPGVKFLVRSIAGCNHKVIVKERDVVTQKHNP